MARGAVIESSLPGPGDEPDMGEEFDENGNPIERVDPDNTPDEPDEENALIEAEARRMGWRPLSEFRGEPGTFVTAQEFIDRGRNFVPFLRKNLEDARNNVTALKGEVTGLRTELGEVKQLAQDFRDAAMKAEERGYQRALVELEAKRREAVEQGNVQEFNETEAEIARLNADRAPPKANGEAPPPPPNPKVPPAPDPAIARFVAENPWFSKDETLNAVMQAEHVALKQSRPELTLEQNLRLAKAAVARRFPGKIPGEAGDPPPAPRRRAAAVLDPSGASGPTSRRSVGIDSIEDQGEREEARRQFNRQKRMIDGFTEEQYMRIYNNPRADALEIAQEGRKRKAN
jgi:hypothetical protein